MNRITCFKYVAGLLWALLIIQCGDRIVGVPDPEIRACLANPRIYPNDPAANDSLNLAIVKGVQFHIRPNVDYKFVLKGKGFSNTKLYIQRILATGTSPLIPASPTTKAGKAILGTVESNDEVHFNFNSSKGIDTTEQVWGILRNRN